VFRRLATPLVGCALQGVLDPVRFGGELTEAARA
jgi:hypothetical protein